MGLAASKGYTLRNMGALGIWLLGSETRLLVQVSPLAVERDGAKDHAGHPPDPVTVAECSKWPCPPSLSLIHATSGLIGGGEPTSYPGPSQSATSSSEACHRQDKVGSGEADAVPLGVPGGTLSRGKLGKAVGKGPAVVLPGYPQGPALLQHP